MDKFNPWQFQPNPLDYFPGLAQRNPWLVKMPGVNASGQFQRNPLPRFSPTDGENRAFMPQAMPQVQQPQAMASTWGQFASTMKDKTDLSTIPQRWQNAIARRWTGAGFKIDALPTTWGQFVSQLDKGTGGNGGGGGNKDPKPNTGGRPGLDDMGK